MADVPFALTDRQFRWRRIAIPTLAGFLAAAGLISAWVAGSAERAAQPLGGTNAWRAMLVYAPLALAISCLLGTWLALAPVSLMGRLTVGLLGVGYLWIAFKLRAYGWHWDVYASCLFQELWVPCLATFVLLRFVRRWLGRLHVFDSNVPASDRPGLQFSVRHMLILTALVALLLAFQPVVPFDLSSPTFPLEFMLTPILAGICAATLTLGAVWAALDVPRPASRVAVILMSSPLAGLTLLYYLRVHWRGDYVRCPCMFFLQALIVVGALLVFRRCGYRLVRASTADLPFSAG